MSYNDLIDNDFSEYEEYEIENEAYDDLRSSSIEKIFKGLNPKQGMSERSIVDYGRSGQRKNSRVDLPHC